MKQVGKYTAATPARLLLSRAPKQQQEEVTNAEALVRSGVIHRDISLNNYIKVQRRTKVKGRTPCGFIITPLLKERQILVCTDAGRSRNHKSDSNPNSNMNSNPNSKIR